MKDDEGPRTARRHAAEDDRDLRAVPDLQGGAGGDRERGQQGELVRGDGEGPAFVAPRAFRLLPGDQRRAMCALYAFLRVTDDLADEPGPADAKRRALDDWRRDLHAALAGEYHHPLFPAFLAGSPLSSPNS